jgi:hypothetical protein
MCLDACREIGGWQWADTQDGEHRLQQVKRPYRDSNMREWQAHLAIHYNNTVSVDKLQEVEDGNTDNGEGGTRRGEALSMAQESGSNVMGAASVRVSLLRLDDDHDNDSSMGGMGGESPPKNPKKRIRARTRRGVEDIFRGTEGVDQLRDLIGSYIYDQQHGTQPPAGNARRSAALPSPHRDQVWYHTAVAVAPGASTMDYADTKKHYQDAVFVRADPTFFGRSWYSDVEVKGDGGETWFAKLLLVFRYLGWSQVSL